MYQLIRVQVLTLTIVAAALSVPAMAAPQTEANRWIPPEDICWAPGPSGIEVEIEIPVRYATQLPGPVDLSVEVHIEVNGGLVGVVPLNLITSTGGFNVTCAGSCPGDCSFLGADSQCTSFVGVGGMGCGCDFVARPLTLIPVEPGDEVGITLVPAVGSIGELWTADDTVVTTFEGFYNSLCNGDGGDQMGCTNCPCTNNAAAGTVGGCLNSSGNSTRLDAMGDASVSLPAGSIADLRFTLSGGPAMATSVLLSGNAVAPTNPGNACFGLSSGVPAGDRDGLRCVVQGIQRHGNRQTNAVGDIDASSGPNRVWGGEAQPNAGIAGASGFAAGQTRYFQVTHRDDASTVCMRGLNTSQAVEVTFTP